MYPPDIKSIDIYNSRCLIRVDYNVPFCNGEIINDFRIKESYDTIKYCLENNCKIILMTHIGRPKGSFDKDLSVKNMINHLTNYFGTEVLYGGKEINFKSVALSKEIKNKSILILENLRFSNAEQENDSSYSELLSMHGDIFINDAFGTAHRAHASNVGVAGFFSDNKKAIGCLMSRELKYLSKSISNPHKPLTILLGGAKVTGKIELVENMIKFADNILVGGAMAFTFLYSLGYEIGDSLLDEKQIENSKRLIELAKMNNVKLILPVDIVVKESKELDFIKCVAINNFNNKNIGLDIGPETVELFKTKIINSSTVLWNGPMGYIEDERFTKGTSDIAYIVKNITDKGKITVIGGGDTVSAIDQIDPKMNFTHKSTGGGSALELLSGKSLPAIEALV